jgi:ribosomal protein S18 acetylase RimI-like enzyme
MTRKASYEIVQADSCQDLDKAFSCGLISLYKDIFSDPPYEEYFSDDDVISMFYSYFEDEIKYPLILFAYLEQEIIGFCTAVPLNESWPDFEVIDFHQNLSRSCYEYFNRAFNATSENTWYLDDLGVRKDKRKQGIGTRLIRTCLAKLHSKSIFLRTSDSNNQAQQLYCNLGFSHIDGLFTLVSHKRSDGSVREDRRIIMLRQSDQVE